MTLPTATLEALRSLQATIGEGNAANGFHDRTRRLRAAVIENGYPEDREELTDHTVATLALFDTETSEAIEEVRKGRAATETYYSASKDAVYSEYEARNSDGTLRKPEGVPAEVADVIIRAFDFAARFGVDIAAAIDEKLAYNATRGRMHGGKKL